MFADVGGTGETSGHGDGNKEMGEARVGSVCVYGGTRATNARTTNARTTNARATNARATNARTRTQRNL